MRSSRPAKLRPADALDVDLRRHARADLRHIGHRRLRLHFQLREVDDRQQRRVECRPSRPAAHGAWPQCRLIGARTTASFSWICVCSSCARAAATDASCAWCAASAVSNAFCEMKFCLTSWALAWRVRSVVASWARCGLEVAARSASCARKLRSVELGDGLADGDPVALAHQDAFYLGGELGSHRGLRNRLDGAGHRQFDRKPLGCSCTMSACANSSAGRSPFLARSAELAWRDAMTAPPPPAAATTRTPTSHQIFARFVISSPRVRPGRRVGAIRQRRFVTCGPWIAWVRIIRVGRTLSPEVRRTADCRDETQFTWTKRAVAAGSATSRSGGRRGFSLPAAAPGSCE